MKSILTKLSLLTLSLTLPLQANAHMLGSHPHGAEAHPAFGLEFLLIMAFIGAFFFRLIKKTD